jgi:beta-xylosidase
MKRYFIIAAILFFGFISGIFAQDTKELRPENPATGTMLSKNTVTVTHSDAGGIGAEKGVMRRDPSDIIKVGDHYYVWYSKGTISPGYDATVWYATSRDGRTWTEKGMALPKGEPGSWEAASVFTPNILVAEGRYWLFYTDTSKRRPSTAIWSTMPV